jgi:stage II sporulation protein D
LISQKTSSHYYPAVRIINRQLNYILLFFSLILLGAGCTKKAITPIREISPKIPTIRVALTDQLSHGSLLFNDTYQLHLEEANYLLDSTLGIFQVSWNNGQLTFRSNSRFFSFQQFERIEFTPLNSGEFSWMGITYQGKIIFVKNQNSAAVINELLLPDYLKGVVPHEIPSHSEEYYQAVVSQTIAAATYALYSLKNPASDYFDLYADNRDQIYQGTRLKTPLVDKAVAESMGLFLQTTSGKLVKIQYHSSCGGMLDFRPQTEQSPIQTGYIKDQINDQINCAISPHYRWTRQMTAQELLENLTSMGLVNFTQAQQWKNQGFTLQLEILSRKSSGRVERIRIELPEKEIILNEGQIRRFLSTKDGNPQLSNLFIIKSSPKNPDMFYIIGAGFGHGRGMCQWGAIGLALRGKTYQEILGFYYPELQLKKYY